jgi:ribosomal protein L11 methyltransferase
MAWLELSVAADQEAAESISELLAQYGYQGGVTVEATPPPDAPADQPGVPLPLEAAPQFPVVLRTYLPLDEHAEATRQRIEQALWHLGQMRPVGPLQTRVLHEEDWANTWKRYYPVQRVGERVVIVPSWLEHTPTPDDVVLHLDPGMAFGTGLHPTTRLCLRLLEREPLAGRSLLDLGCGSGILAIAAAKLGAAPVLALDTDSVAVEVASENVARNGVAAQVQTAAGSLPVPSAPCDVVVANIIADVLIELAPELAATLAPGGRLITSGIIQDREDEVALTLAAAGLHLRERLREGEWVALLHSPAA